MRSSLRTMQNLSFEFNFCTSSESDEERAKRLSISCAFCSHWQLPKIPLKPQLPGPIEIPAPKRPIAPRASTATRIVALNEWQYIHSLMRNQIKSAGLRMPEYIPFERRFFNGALRSPAKQRKDCTEGTAHVLFVRQR